MKTHLLTTFLAALGAAASLTAQEAAPAKPIPPSPPSATAPPTPRAQPVPETPPGDPFVKSPGVEAAVEDGLWKNLMLVLEVYALDKNDALAVLESERGSGARYRRVVALAATGKARLDTLTALPCKSGQKAVAESIDEVTYPTKFHLASRKGGLATPMTFETRNVGDELEIEPVLGPDGRTCELSLIPQHISLAGFRDIAGMADDPRVAQPLFASQKLTTSTTLPCNEPHYLGTLTPPGTSGLGVAKAEVWLAFVRVNLVGPTAAEMKPPAKPMDWSALELQYSFYTLERAAARELLIAPPGLSAPWEKLQTLLGEKKARFESLVSMKTKSGQRAMAEEIHEVRYATEYDAPGFTRSTEKTTTGNVTTTVTREVPNPDGTPGVPSTFETRNAGMSIEVEPVVGPDALTIDLSHAVSSVDFLGDLKTTGVAAQYPSRPLFETRKITTSLSLLGGQHTLAGTFNPPGADGVNDRTDTGRTWLVFVRAVPNDP